MTTINSLYIQLDDICKKIDSLRKFVPLKIDSELEQLEHEIALLEHKKWEINNEIRKYQDAHCKYIPNPNSINNPDNYEYVENTIKCKTCNNIGDELYLCHKPDCRWKLVTSVVYVMDIRTFGDKSVESLYANPIKN